MATLVEQLSEIVGEAFVSLGYRAEAGKVTPSLRPELGQFQCNGAFSAGIPVAGGERQKPAVLAEQVLAVLEQHPDLSQLSVAGGGFINFSLSDSFLVRYVQTNVDSQRLGSPRAEQPQHYIVDFGGPNVAKAMHVGHLRSSILGDCLQRLFRFAGHKVTSDIHLGDWGTQMGMLICETQRRYPSLPYFDSNFSGAYPSESPVTIDDLGEMYPIASQAAKHDPEQMEAARLATAELQQGRPGYRALWEHFVRVSREALEADFRRLGVEFDLWWGESTVQERIPGLVAELKARGIAEDSDGAVIIPLETPPKSKKMPPMLLLKSDGAVIYGSTDLATIEKRILEMQANVILYVVDTRQALHFKQLFQAAHQIGWGAAKATLEHINLGTVNGSDGKPFKTRAGGVLRLQDLLQLATEAAMRRLDEAELAKDFDPQERQEIARQVGLGAVKYADLMHNRVSDYVFDIDKFTMFEGNTGPYLQYAVVRGQSILRKAKEGAVEPGPLVAIQQPEERLLLLELCRFSEAIQLTCTTRSPHHLCEYAYGLGRAFSRFYNAKACHILHEKDPARRASLLSISLLAQQALRQVLTLLGIEIPERM
jgi:arginyl-tRNA synthetase